MNKLEKLLQMVLASNNGEEDDLTALIRQKIDEVGLNPTDEDVEKAYDEIVSFLEARLAELSNGGSSANEPSKEELMKTLVEKTATPVKEFLENNSYKYESEVLDDERILFHLIFTVPIEELNEKCDFEVYICAQTNPDVCRIDVILPYKANKSTELVLCKTLLKINYVFRFGGFKYDERDGEIKYSLTFPTEEGATVAEVERYFDICMSSAFEEVATIQKACTGKFDAEEAEELKASVLGLLMNLD